MKIQSVIGIKDCTIAIYWSAVETAFRFDIIDSKNKCYICPYGFPSVNSAESIAISVVNQITIEKEPN